LAEVESASRAATGQKYVTRVWAQEKQIEIKAGGSHQLDLSSFRLEPELLLKIRRHRFAIVGRMD
jgi:hypothetical protein